MNFKYLSIVITSAILIKFMLRNKNNETKTDLESISNDELEVIASIESSGYRVERHTVVTQDGYILTLHRLPHVENGSQSQCQRKVRSVLLIPGLAGSSETWFILGPKSLPFVLSDNKYDVWLGNVRGTTHSRRHVTLDPNSDAKFWNFSYHEMALFDLPAIIDYIRTTTHQERLYYIGYSQGVMNFLIMGSERPEYNKKIHLMIGMAPTPYITLSKNSKNDLLVELFDMLLKAAQFFNIHEMFAYNKHMGGLARTICDENIFNSKKLCKDILLFDDDFETDEENHQTKDLIPNLFTNFPAGSSVKTFLHYTQGYRSQRLQKFDYGEEENVKKYGSVQVPEYDMRKVTAPSAIYYSFDDYLVSYKDIRLLIEKLPNVVQKIFIKKGFNHSYFLWSSHARVIYDNILKTMQRFSG